MSISLPAVEFRAITALAKKVGINRSALIRKAVAQFRATGTTETTQRRGRRGRRAAKE